MEPLIFEDFDEPYVNRLSPDGEWRLAGPWTGTGGNWLDPTLTDINGGELSLTVAANELRGSEIQTLDGYSYGYYETSMKVTDTPGVVNSFFVIAEGYDPGTIEIDVEFLTNEDWIDSPDSGRVHFVLHPSNEQRIVDLPFNPTLEFHRYGFLWEPGKISYTVDGEIVATNEDPRSDVGDTAAYIMMNAWTGNPSWGGGPPSQDATSHYDFVKFYDGATGVITTVRGTGGNDSLSGGTNIDVFEASTGNDVFQNFTAGVDYVDFSPFGSLSAADVSASRVGEDLRLSFKGNTITIDGVTRLGADETSLDVAFDPVTIEPEPEPEPEPQPEPEPKPEPEPQPEPEPKPGAGPEPQPEGSGFWEDDVAPPAQTDIDRNAVELGIKFRPSTDGAITAVQFYETAESNGSHPVSLWSAGGQLLATQDFAGGDGVGWREVTFDAPVKVHAGETYVASYHSPEGRYAVTLDFFWQPVDSGDLTASVQAGAYNYGAAGSFPDEIYRASNYWVDVVFAEDATGSTAPSLPAPTMEGTDADDRMRGTTGDDVILGGKGYDTILGRDGDDVLRGQNGNDFLRGHLGSDVLIGGGGGDTFQFRSIYESNRESSDEIRAGDDAIAFEGAGSNGGDIIDLSSLDADHTIRGNQAFTFGTSDKGGLWLSNIEGRTLVSGNTDGDGRTDFQFWIDDGAVTASDYAASDFIL